MRRSDLERQVAGALRNTIDAHGPITAEHIGSASKRVVSQLMADGIKKKPRPRTGRGRQG